MCRSDFDLKRCMLPTQSVFESMELGCKFSNVTKWNLWESDWHTEVDDSKSLNCVHLKAEKSDWRETRKRGCDSSLLADALKIMQDIVWSFGHNAIKCKYWHLPSDQRNRWRGYTKSCFIYTCTLFCTSSRFIWWPPSNIHVSVRVNTLRVAIFASWNVYGNLESRFNRIEQTNSVDIYSGSLGAVQAKRRRNDWD